MALISHIHFVIMNYVFFMPKQNKLIIIIISDLTLEGKAKKKHGFVTWHALNNRT